MGNEAARRLAAIGAVGLALAAWGAAGCGKPGVRDYCTRECQCLTGGACDTQEEVYECVTYRDAQRGGAILERCVGEFDAMMACWALSDDCPATEETCPDERAVYLACRARSES